MTDVNENSVAYRAGLWSGRIIQAMLAGFVLSIGLITLSGLFPKVVRGPLEVSAVALGTVCCVGLGLLVRQKAVVAFGGYIAFVGVGAILQTRHPRPIAALIAVSIGSIGSAVVGMLLVLQSGRRSKELDRLLFSEATSVAFFITMLFGITYALLESWIRAPKLSMWATWSVGMGSWAILSFVFKRRYS